MSRVNIENIDVAVGNNSQKILPVPINKNPSPSVPEPVDYGSSPYPLALKPQKNRVNDESQYCNFISPAPRNQQLNVPYEGNKYCPTFKPQPYKKDSCYLVDSKAQGVTGIVCNNSGGTDNANFVRGNQFGLDYGFDQFDNIKEKEYTIEQPVQIPMELQNPEIVLDKSTFYPENNYYLSKERDYLTYPKASNYTEDGYPTMRFPYKVLNPPNNIESFSNSNDYMEIIKNNKEIIILFLVILLLLILFYFTIL